MKSSLRLSPQLSLPLDIVTEAIGIVATRGAGKSYTSAVLIEEAFAAGVPCVVLDPSGVYHGLRSAGEHGEEAGLPIYVFGGPHGDLPLEATAGALLADLVVDSGHSFVLDLSDLSKARMRQFVADFLERLYDRKARSRTTLLLIVDEADEFAPQKPRGETARSLGAMETIAKRGRARGLGIVMITQRTQALNKDVLDLIETLVAMRQLAERSRESVKGWIADKELRDEAGVLESLQTLPTGTAWVWSPLRGILKKVEIRRIKTFDSYRTPKPGEVAVEPQQRAELDLDALGERMRQTVERAKADDPRELRGRIRELERTLAERSAEQVEVEKVVEVPVLTDSHLRSLRTILDRGESLARQAEEYAAGLRAALKDTDDKISGAGASLTAGGRGVAQQARPADVSRRREPSAAPSPASNGTGDSVSLGKGERTVLDVLAEYPEGRTQNELAFLAGYSAKASTIGVILAALRKAGFVEAGQPIRLTAEGLTAAGGARTRPTGRALLEQWLQHPRMGGGERKVLLALIDLYPNAPTNEELCDLTGYSPIASTMGVILSNLRKLGLVEKGARRAVPEFMEAIR